jgi:hypothetical protein
MNWDVEAGVYSWHGDSDTVAMVTHTVAMVTHSWHGDTDTVGMVTRHSWHGDSDTVGMVTPTQLAWWHTNSWHGDTNTVGMVTHTQTGSTLKARQVNTTPSNETQKGVKWGYIEMTDLLC